MTANSSEPEYPPGHRLDDRFLIRSVDGRSGMATIYRAEDGAQDGRIVAVKVPLLRVESDPAGFARFLREEEVGTQFDHPGLVKFYPVAGGKSRPYLVMEFLPGETLSVVLARKRPLPEAEALAIASRICEPIRHMHERGIVHRDLKPANLMISEDGSVRVFDFGLAAAPRRRDSLFGRLAPVLGTPEYMAPEQVESGAIDERADIYSLGAILYEMLTGQAPFHTEDRWDSARARIGGDPIAPRKLNPDISLQAEEIVLRAMRRRPEERYPTVAALQADLAVPDRVEVTGLSERLQPVRFRLSFQATPILAGLLLGLGAVSSFVGLFFLLRFALRR